MIWRKENSLIICEVPSFFIATTTKEFFKEKFVKKDINIPYLTEEKKSALFSFLEYYNLEKNKILLCEQVHSNKVIFVEELNNINSFYVKNKEIFIFKDIDGIITTLNEAAVVIFTADCIPLFVFSKKGGIFGLVHIGRRGLEEGICEQLILSLKSKSLQPNDFFYILGPHICPNCYSVDDQPYSLFEKLNLCFHKLFVDTNNLLNSNICTYHNFDFFSYRKDKTSMRNLSIIFSL
ncbi:MAG: polyphenol oxidase family protein [Elusimicrobiota bacterium]|nr:polyphenol oxidase family protein [Endomicrobiia bacterium]MDW8166013.1 polyphenol oxidase family protein [Elusimicrobiota bacterium]